MRSVRIAGLLAAVLGLVLPGTATAAQATLIPSSACPRLPVASGPTVRVTPGQAGRLPAIVAGAEPGTTILLADGVYAVDQTIRIRAEDVALRSASGKPSAVVLDGGYRVGDLVAVDAGGATIAELTLRRSAWHLVHAVPPEGADALSGLSLYRLALVDASQQFVKINPNGGPGSVDRGRLECSTLRLTVAGRPRVSTVLPCYTGGIDAHAARGWAVRLNRFSGIYCKEGLAEHAVHFWVGSRDTLVERNVIVNCARGIGFGLGDRGHTGGMIRNNVVVAGGASMDTGIGLENADGARVYHNTVWVSARARGHFSGIDVRFPGSSADVRNNLTTRITIRDSARARVGANLEGAPGTLFVAPGRLDFHLRPSARAAIDRGEPLAEAGLDLDGQPHTRGRPDLGADELSP